MKKHTPISSMRKAFILSASFLFILQACKKDGELVPDFEDNTTSSVFTDTITIATVTKLPDADSIFADKIAIGLVGEYRDSSFGYSNAKIHIQPRLSSNAPAFSNNDEVATVDSVVLSLEYGTFYGDTSVPQTIEVHRIDETLITEDSDDNPFNYPSNYVVAIEPTPLASVTVYPKPTSAALVYEPDNLGDTTLQELSPQLRINLGTALGNEIFDKEGGPELVDSDAFAEYFKGLRISATNGALNNKEAAILYFRLTASNTKMTIYYHTTSTDSSGTVTEYRAFDFPVNSSSVRFNTFEHDYTGSGAEAALNGQPTTVSYVQAMVGLQTVIKFPTLREQFGGKILVNKAELVMPIANGSYSEGVGNAKRLILAEEDESSNLNFIPDALINADNFGGDIDTLNNQYVFNITRYLQSYLNGGQTDNGITVLVSGSAVRAERAVILNEQSSGKKIKLNLYYTNID